ncbi:hypothetical protein QNI19_22695 [Cytophagaceae bacterium DM2B3-1]|uniref:Carboxypeptidase-like regulatory domain-containing protein n=2 Tax=Xanthocytophaga TaxID=3078918 RepID=A0ABT7CPU5_9BACT|nr:MULTISPECIES: hypothetical protein [Xanthocytophaga]MDJ1495763.1 hypothetical protein [Xanthocytophaga flavus]MDJ1506462.1 hypothetical protein [Xanthocytophaga agilis]
MKKQLFFLLLYLGLMSGGICTIQAQVSRFSPGGVLVQGFTLQRDSMTVAPYVTIVNKRSQFGTISADNGYFSIFAQRGDTLEFSAVNLQTAIYVLPAYYAADRVAVRAVMNSKTYQLNEVVVRPYTEKQFKKDFLALQLPDEQPELQLPAIPRLATPSSVAQSGAGVGVVFSGPLTALYNSFSREAKSRKKLAKMMAEDKRKKMYEAKVNPFFVGKITGLSGADLDEFMKYCTLSEEFVIEANEYDVAMALQECLKNFKAERN